MSSAAFQIFVLFLSTLTLLFAVTSTNSYVTGENSGLFDPEENKAGTAEEGDILNGWRAFAMTPVATARFSPLSLPSSSTGSEGKALEDLTDNELYKLLQQARTPRLNPRRVQNWRVVKSGNNSMRPVFGKRQIAYRQCFFNPISCF